MSDNRRTPLHDVHKALGARLIPFGGWEMPVEYSRISREHTAVRTASGMFDVSHMGEFEVEGPGAIALLQHVTSNDVSRLADGQAQYTAMPYPEGTVVDDLLIYRHSANRFMVVVNAANRQKDFDWICSHNRWDARVHDVSDSTALIAVQGPLSETILAPLTPVALATIGSYRFREGLIAGHPALISRTGYTGEDGFELYLGAEHATALWNAVLEAGTPHGLLPAGLGARNTLRLEARLMLYGNDIDDRTTLLEAGLGWIVKLDKGDFIGRDALLREKSDGPKRKLIGFEMLGRDIARDHYPVDIDGAECGSVTSGSPSITLKKNIGLAYVPSERSQPGQALSISVRGRLCDAVIVDTPFYRRRK